MSEAPDVHKLAASLGYFSVQQTLRFPKLVAEEVEAKVAHIPGIRLGEGALYGFPDAIDAASEALSLPWKPVRAPPRVTLRPGEVNHWVLMQQASKQYALREYQHKGLERLTLTTCDCTGALLADDMGLGKTRTACAWLRVFESANRPSLVVCPASVREQWCAELAREDVVVLGPRTKTAKSQWAWQCAASGVPGVYVTSYNLAGAALEAFPQPPQALVVDEAHNIKGRKNPWSKTLLECSLLVPWRLALTGTPIFSRPADLWTILKFLFNKRFGSGWEFDRRYCNGHEGPYGWVNKGESNTAELKKRLACYTVRRTKGEVLDELPPLSRSVRWVEATASARAAFTSALGGSMGDGALAEALAATLDGKLDECVSYCASLGQPFLCFTYLRSHCQELAKRLGEEGVKVYAIDGEQSAEERRATLNKAKSEGASVVATLGAMSTGVNAQGIGSYGVFHALSWVPAELMQAEARLHRMGQKDSVHWTYICMRDSMDEHVVRTVVDRLTTWTKTMTHTGDGSADMRADFQGDTGADASVLSAIWASATGTDDGGD